MQKIRQTILYLSVFLLLSCDSVDYTTLTFLGDSIIARWDLEESFPSYVVENKGISGSGIESFSQYSNRYIDKNIVVLVGTNDLYTLSDKESIDAYAENYVQMIISTGAKKIFLFSILPRDFAGDAYNINETIETLNMQIKNLSNEYVSVKYIDVFESFMHDKEIDPQLFSDGLHLSPYGYEILSDYLNKAI